MGILNLVIGFASFFAAIFWLISAKFKLNRKNGTSMMNMADIMQKQSKFSAYGAIFATIAAFFQSLIILDQEFLFFEILNNWSCLL